MSKITIFSFAVNDKFPLDIMRRQFTKYIKEDFDFVLFNDAENSKTESDINTIASCNNIQCVRVPQHIHQTQRNPSVCYAETLNWAVRDYAVKNQYEIIAMMHSDIFPVCNTSISEIIGEYSIASTVEFRLVNDQPINYLYPAFTIINMNLLKDPNELDFGLEDGLDAGGKTRYFVKNNPNAVKFLPNHQTSYFIAILPEEDSMAKYYKEDLLIARKYGLSAGWITEGFYHYMAGSQWNGANPSFAQGHKERMDLFLKYFY